MTPAPENRASHVGIGLLCGDEAAANRYIPGLAAMAAERPDLMRIVAICYPGGNPKKEAPANHAGRHYVDLGDFLGDPEVHLVVDLSPALRGRCTKRILSAGKHEFVHDVIETDIEAAAAALEMASTRGLIVECGPPVMLSPDYGTVRSLVDAGYIGQIHHVRADASAEQGQASAVTGQGHVLSEGTEPLLTIGIFAIHAIVGLLGPAERATAVSRPAPRRIEAGDENSAARVAEGTHLLLEFDEGVIANLSATYLGGRPETNTVEFVGDRGSIRLDVLNPWSTVQVYRADYTLGGGSRTRDSGDLTGWATPPPGAGTGDWRRFGWAAGLVDVIEYVSRQNPAAESSERALRALHVLEILSAASRSVREGRAVAIGDPNRRER